MQRAAAANAAREAPNKSPSSANDIQTPSPKRQKVSSEKTTTAPATDDLQVISAAVAIEENKRKEALARQAAEAGETEWVLDFAGSDPLPQDPGPFIVAAGSLDGDDDEVQLASYGGRQVYGNFKRKNKVRVCLLNFVLVWMFIVSILDRRVG